MKLDVVVVGSYNQDMVWRTARFPRPGETRLGEFSTGPGGKGFNQAVAAARQDARTAFIGAIGRDALGDSMLALAASEHIEADCERLTDVATGTAAILVETSGENLIVVGSGANAALGAAHVEARRAVIESARVLMTQHEVPDAASMAALRIARAAGLLCLHNPAPPRDGDVRPLLRLADVLTPNESELGLLLKSRGGELASIRRPGALDDDTLHALCRQIEVPTVVLTLGARGVFVSHRDDTLRGDVSAHYRVAAEAVKAIDTTGAGDAFSGALAAQLAAAPGAAFVDGVRYASRVAALSTEVAGAALSIPRRADVLARFERS